MGTTRNRLNLQQRNFKLNICGGNIVTKGNELLKLGDYRISYV